MSFLSKIQSHYQVNASNDLELGIPFVKQHSNEFRAIAGKLRTLESEFEKVSPMQGDESDCVGGLLSDLATIMESISQLNFESAGNQMIRCGQRTVKKMV